jgi:hypothetical protein
MYAAFTSAAQLPEDASNGAKMLADPPIWLPAALIALCVIALAWSLWPREDEAKNPTDGGSTAQTKGTNSPAFAGNQFHGPATFNLNAAEPEPRRKIKFHRLEAMNKCPPMRISDALRYLVAIGYQKEQARLELQQAFLDDRIVVWGRAEVPPSHMQSPRVPRETWEIVRPSYWSDFRLTGGAFSDNEKLPQTEAQEHVRKNLLRRYWSLRVSEGQMREEWHPPGSESDDDDRVDWKTV